MTSTTRLHRAVVGFGFIAAIAAASCGCGGGRHARSKSPSASLDRQRDLCRHECDAATRAASKLGCKAPIAGCKELCVAGFSSEATRCIDVSEDLDDCVTTLPDSGFMCDDDNQVDTRPTSCASEKAALDVCKKAGAEARSGS